MKSVLTTIFAIGLLALQTNAQDQKAEAKSEPKLDLQKLSYAIGMNIGNSLTNIKHQSIDIDVDTMTKAVKDVMAGNPTTLTEQEARQAIGEMNNELRRRHDEERKEVGEKNKKEGEAFLAQNAKKPDVKTTSSGLQYKIITEGKGEIPKATDTVTTQYRGRLIDGTEFDSSYKRGQPAQFPVTGVIKGWTEALQMMPVGSKWELYIPSDLAYGERGSGQNIGPNATLIFEIELLGIKSKPAETNQAVSGEIIKVPSAEELKKGAKIEVIRPGQTNELKPKK